MQTAQSNAATIGQALQQANEGQTVRAITDADKAAAAEILVAVRGKVDAAAVLKTAGEGLYGTVMRHVAVNGATFDGIEAAAPELKTDKALSATFRPIKSMILTAQKNGVSLLDAEGKPLSKSALAAANKEKSGKTKPQAERETDETGTRLLTEKEIILGAIGFLRASAALREEFGAELLGLAEAYKRDVEIAEAVRLTQEAAGKTGAEAAAAGIAAAQERQDAEAAEAHRQAEAVKANAAALEAEYKAAGMTKPDADKGAPTVDVPKAKRGRKAKQPDAVTA